MMWIMLWIWRYTWDLVQNHHNLSMSHMELLPIFNEFMKCIVYMALSIESFYHTDSQFPYIISLEWKNENRIMPNMFGWQLEKQFNLCVNCMHHGFLNERYPIIDYWLLGTDISMKSRCALNIYVRKCTVFSNRLDT